MPKGDIQRLYERRAKGFNDKAKRLGIRGTVTAAQLAALPLVCTYCGKVMQHRGSEFDHQTPFFQRGTNTIDNIVRCCEACNGVKYTKNVEELKGYLAGSWTCVVCGRLFRPRYADVKRGYGITCSRACSGKRRWQLAVRPVERAAADGQPTA